MSTIALLPFLCPFISFRFLFMSSSARYKQNYSLKTYFVDLGKVVFSTEVFLSVRFTLSFVQLSTRLLRVLVEHRSARQQGQASRSLLGRGRRHVFIIHVHGRRATPIYLDISIKLHIDSFVQIENLPDPLHFLFLSCLLSTLSVVNVRVIGRPLCFGNIFLIWLLLLLGLLSLVQATRDSFQLLHIYLHLVEPILRPFLNLPNLLCTFLKWTLQLCYRLGI